MTNLTFANNNKTTERRRLERGEGIKEERGVEEEGSKKAIIIISSCTLIYFPARAKKASERMGGETGVREAAEQSPDMHAEEGE